MSRRNLASFTKHARRVELVKSEHSKTSLENILGQMFKPKKETKMKEILSNYYSKISQCYSKQKWTPFFKQTSGLLRYTRRIPIGFFYPHQDILIKAITEHGAAPHLSWIIDYGFRLLRQRTKESRNLFKALTTSFQKSRRKNLKDAPVLLRTRSGKYRLVSMNAGYSAAILLLSNFGIRQSLEGNYYPFNYLRVAALLGECQDLQKKSGEKPREAIENCSLLAKSVKSKLGENGFADLQSQIGDMTVNGAKVGLEDCLSSLAGDRLSQGIDSYEKYKECRERQRQSQGKGESIAEGNGSELDAALDAFGNLNTDTFSGFPVDDPFGEMQSFTENDDGSFKVERFDREKDWTSTTTYDHYGRETSYQDSQGSVSFEHHSDGTTTVTTTTTNEETGSTITVTATVDENGNQVGEAEITIEPEGSESGDEFTYDSCARNLQADLLEAVKGFRDGRGLDPWIRPDPDAPVETEQDMCLPSFEGGPSTKCKSVALCLDGYRPNGDCLCSSAGSESRSLPSTAGSSRCTMINCGDVACNPTTGTCSTGSYNFPGRVRPLPLPIGPKIMQNRIRIHRLIDKRIGNLGRDMSRSGRR